MSDEIAWSTYSEKLALVYSPASATITKLDGNEPKGAFEVIVMGNPGWRIWRTPQGFEMAELKCVKTEVSPDCFESKQLLWGTWDTTANALVDPRIGALSLPDVPGLDTSKGDRLAFDIHECIGVDDSGNASVVMSFITGISAFEGKTNG